MSTENINIYFNSDNDPNLNDNNYYLLPDWIKMVNMGIVSDILENSNIVLLIWFLAIYLLLYLLVSIFYISEDDNDTKIIVSRIFDIVVIGVFSAIILINYYTISDENKETILSDSSITYIKYINDNQSIFSIVLFILGFYFFIFLFVINMTFS
jgi:hypothetical protein